MTIYNTYNSMALYLKLNHHEGSAEHEDFFHISMALNRTTTAAVLGHYMSEFYGEDRNLKYKPRAGYAGTMPPGEYPEDVPFKDLPTKNPLPWPYFQMLPFHARPPVTNPYQVSAMEFAALNNMIDDVSILHLLLFPNKYAD
jgi:hypothetical protein